MIHGLLRERILTLKYRPGEYLNIDELARQHEISPIPVREAVARLVAERLVVMRPHVGAEVAPLDQTSVREIFAMLSGLETAAVSDGIERFGEEDLDKIEQIHIQMEALHRPQDFVRWDQLNAAFHLQLASLAALPVLVEHLKVAFEHWDRARRHLFELVQSDDPRRAQKEHGSMIHALKRRDAERLRNLLHLHNEKAKQRYLKLLAHRVA